MAQIIIKQLASVLESKGFRIEAEFYLSQDTQKTNFWRGEDISDFIQYGTSKQLNENKSGFPVLRLNEFESFFIKNPQKYCSSISKKEFEELKLKVNDVLVCRTNGNPAYVGKASVVMEYTNFAFASYLFKVRTNEKINPQSLVVFLNSEFGREQINKYSMVSNQTNFSPAKFREIKIPKISNETQRKIAHLVKQAYEKLKKTKNEYSFAEKIIEKIISPPKNKVNKTFTANFSETLKNNRLDAEYHSPEVKEIIKEIEKSSTGFSYLDEENIKDNTFTAQKGEKYEYIELADISESLSLVENTITEVGEKLPTRARRMVKKGDIIVSSIEGSLGKSAIINSSKNNVLCSNGFFVLNTAYAPEVLIILMKNKAIQRLLERGCSGTILMSITKNELMKIPLPKISKDKQNEIIKLIRTSHELYFQSKKDLETAASLIKKEMGAS
jgi:restriction endonuclease S subunit